MGAHPPCFQPATAYEHFEGNVSMAVVSAERIRDFTENLACQRAKARRSMSIEVVFHDADTLPRNRAAGRLFGREAGYEWKWRKQRRPNLAAVGKKSL